MKILVTAATDFELQSVQKKLENIKHHKLQFCAMGIGCTATTFSLTRKISSNNFDLILNVGIAGSYNKNLSLGDVVVVKTEVFGNLGITYPDRLSTLFDEGLIDKNEHPFSNGELFCQHLDKFNTQKLKHVRGLTVETASGEQNQIERLKKMFNADIETMEGAAFFYVCNRTKSPFLEIRTISNYVEPRDKSKWNIPLALNNLAKETFDFLNNLQTKN
jgi:futalosine hydrolase